MSVIIPTLVLPGSALFRFRSHWPRWRAATVTLSVARNYTDSTYNNNGGSGLAGGTVIESGGGVAAQSRWAEVTRSGNVLDLDNVLSEEGQYSARPTEGGLYTAKGSFEFATGILTDITSILEVPCGLSWDIEPALAPPGLPVPAGSVQMRGRADGRNMLMQVPVSGLGPFYSWGAFVGTIGAGTEVVSEVNQTGFDPIGFPLGALAATEFTWEKTQSIVTTYSPGPDDPDIGYYPVRGSTTTTASVSVTLEFEV